MTETPREGASPWARAAQVTAMVTNFAMATVVGIWVGNWADTKLGTSPWLVLVGMIAGLGVGVEVLIVLIRRFEKLERESEKKEKNEGGP